MSEIDPNNDLNPTRWLKVKPREGESTTLTLEINPKDLWASQGIFSFVGEFGDESGEKRTQGERVSELLRKFSPRGLEYQEIDRYLNVGKSLYTVLDRLEDRQLITKRRSKTDARRWVYCLPYHTTEEENTTIANCELSIANWSDTPPPTSFSNCVELVGESATRKELEVIQQQFNTDSTVIQQPQNVELREKAQTVEDERDVESQEFIQQTTKDEGERGCVEQVQFDGVLQNERQVDLPTTQQDSSSRQTKSFDSISGQEAFQQKYQAVEVLNSEGEWLGGYFVHKCLEVANLAGIERKYALVDEFGDKYVFWGEIRLPRVK